MGFTPLLARLWRGTGIGSAGRWAWLSPQPCCGMLSKVGSPAGSHGGPCRSTRQERCRTAPCKRHPQEGAVGWDMGAAVGVWTCCGLWRPCISPGMCREVAPIEPAAVWWDPRGGNPCVGTNWRPEWCRGPWKGAKPVGHCCVLHAGQSHPLCTRVIAHLGAPRHLRVAEPAPGRERLGQELCPGTKLPAHLLMFSFSFCFRGQRGLGPLKQTENKDCGEPALLTTK